MLAAVGLDCRSQQPNFTDTLMCYGAPLAYMCEDSLRSRLCERESIVGYRQCYDEFMELLTHTAEEAASHDNPIFYDLEMSHLFMSWQDGRLSADSTRYGMRRLMESCKKQCGQHSTAYTTTLCIMAEFDCATGQFDDADSCSRLIFDNYQKGVEMMVWQYSIALHSKMVAMVGLGNLSGALEVASEIIERYNKDHWLSEIEIEIDDKLIKGQILSDHMLLDADRLARQMILPMLPPAPQTIETFVIEPWPLVLPKEMLLTKSLLLLAVFNLYELLFHLNLSEDCCEQINMKIDQLSKGIYDYEMIDTIPPPLAAEMGRRLAVLSTIYEKRYKKETYIHNDKATGPMKRWRNCLALEQLNYGSKSAVSLLYYATEWIKKKYPLNMLPYIEEAIETMHHDYLEVKPTNRQLMHRRHDCEWLRNEWSEFARIVNDLPEYHELIISLQTLRKECEP